MHCESVIGKSLSTIHVVSRMASGPERLMINNLNSPNHKPVSFILFLSGTY
jgi:hypothetical protein